MHPARLSLPPKRRARATLPARNPGLGLLPATLLAVSVLLSACGGGQEERADGVVGASVSESSETGGFQPGMDDTTGMPPANEGLVFAPERDAAAPVGTDAVASIVARKNVPAVGDPVRGIWSAVVPWPVMAIHASVLPDGRVMTFGTDLNGKQTAKFFYDVWDPTVGTGSASHLTLPNTTNTDIFCSAQLVLPQSGDLLLSGGDIYDPVRKGTLNQPNPDVTIFRTGTNELVSSGTMNRPRWYATATTLPSGEIYLQGGSGGNDRAEVRQTDGRFRLLTGFATNDLSSAYPRNWVGPDGKIFGMAYRSFYRIDPTGNGTRTALGTATGYNWRWDSASVMFAPGRILNTGGPDARAAIIDIRGASPVVTEAAPMSQARAWHNTTVLADGRVAVTGGSAASNQATGVAYAVELYDPATDRWTVGPAAQRMRLYHSTAVLLADGSVLTAGGGAPGPQTNLNAEIYFPPYLFASNGQAAARPTIASAPLVANPRGSIVLDSPDAASIRRITMVATGSVTHSVDMNQRFVELSFSRSGSQLVARLPSNAFDTPPGYYMVFAINAAGTPSVARIVRVNVDTDPALDPDIVPVWRYSAPTPTGGLRFQFSTDPGVGGEWVREGQAFFGLSVPRPNAVPIYRYSARNAAGQVRYMFSSDGTLSEGWTREAIAFHAYGAAGAGLAAVNEFHRVQDGWYLGYASATSFGNGFTNGGAAFFVPTSNGATIPSDTTAPSAPTGLSATAASMTSVTLNWGASTDAGGSGLAGYRVYRGGIPVSPTLVTGTQYIDSGLAERTSYQYVVRAVDGAGNPSAESNGVTITTGGLPPTGTDPDIAAIWRYSAPGAAADLRYLYSSDPSIGGEWTRQGEAFFGYKAARPGTMPVYRYRATSVDGTVRFLMAADPAVGNGWTREQVLFHAWAAPTAGAVTVNEFYRVQDGWYLGYGTSAAFGSAWRLSGPVFFVPGSNRLP